MNAADQRNPDTDPRSKTIYFPLGHIVATPAALELLDSAALDFADLLQRHQSGDWGCVSPEDAEQNDSAAVGGSRIMSSYPVGGVLIWVITEADRSATTLLLPEDY